MLILGVATLLAYVKIGHDHQANYGQKYKVESSMEARDAN
jgi:hypothetical protein